MKLICQKKAGIMLRQNKRVIECLLISEKSNGANCWCISGIKENLYSLPKTVKNGSETLNYTYDANGNIISIKDSAGESTFRYDELNQLIRENNHQSNKTITYAYDLGGNLTVEKEYAFTTTETLPDTPVKTMTGTYDSAWKDKLLSWDGTAMTYDAIGNMLTRGGTTYTWTQGRRLSGVENGKSIKYLYDHTGARVKKQ